MIGARLAGATRSRPGRDRPARPRPQAGPPAGPAGHPALLRASSITKIFHADGGQVPAVRGVDLTLHRGQFVAVMGPSGSGKSTLLHLLGGLERPTSGEIWLDGRRVDTLSQARWAVLRRRHVGFVFQFFNLLSNMTVADNVELAALMGGATRRQAAQRRDELLGELGLRGRADAAPARLSGGEQQRVALARAMANRPSLLLADEPTGNLDSAASRAVLRLLSRAHADGQTILLVTHDARVASAAERVICLSDGMIVDDALMCPPAPGPAAGHPGLAAPAGA
ncbi:MAG TPA: ABC transporter ATP-binding protein, partial [Streptosporangiaceae bacterium]|nr:ABC transporter ATP-binding protein [Streptosporangiaceae bacterium]